VLGARISSRVLDAARGGTLLAVPAPFPRLTAREREVLELVARGYQNARVGYHLGLSEKTVRNHISAILAKLPAATRAEALRAVARSWGEKRIASNLPAFDWDSVAKALAVVRAI